MVGYRKKAVCVRRQIDPHHIGFLVDHVIDEAGILVGESVVVLTPDMGGKQIVEGGNRAPPLDMARDLQPFCMLVEHGIHNMDKGFITGEKSVPAGKKIAFEQPLAK